jgi:SAM-dependent methyltransferase
MLLCFIKKDLSIHAEGFEQQDKYKVYENDDIYNSFYADIYDELFIQPNKIEAEVDEIIHITGALNGNEKDKKNFKVCDLGCGRGHHVDQLKHKGVKSVIGCDKSDAMLKNARDLYPSSKFIKGDFMKPMLFSEEEFNVLTCFYFTVYYVKDKRAFFRNCYNWLKPEGYLILHLVDRNHFDPVVPGGKPLFLVSPQKYAKERITKSKITFDNFIYNADFDLDPYQNKATFHEKFKFNDGKVRKQEHTLYMETETRILTQAQDAGFIIQGKIDLMNCAYENQYLYILVKSS